MDAATSAEGPRWERVRGLALGSGQDLTRRCPIATRTVPDAPRGALVWARASVVGAAGLGSGVVSHLLGGGYLPSAGVLLALLGLSVVASAQFLLDWASPRRLVALVVVAQGAWHVVLSALAGHAGDEPVATRAAPAVPAASGPRTGSLHDVYVASVPSAAAPAGGGDHPGLLAHQLDHLAQQGVAMVLAHVLGAAALGWFLARGERALVTLAQLAAARLRAGLTAALGPAVRPVLVPRPSRLPLVQVLPVGRWAVRLRRTLPRRGPPALLAA